MGGEVVTDTPSEVVGLTSARGCETVEDASPADEDASATPITFVEVDAALIETLRPFLGLVGIRGITGTIGTLGTAGLILGLLCAGAGCGLEGMFCGTAEDGVVGRVESASEGACEVTGVSSSETAGAAGLQSLSGSIGFSIFVSLSPLCDGNLTGSISDCGALCFFRRLAFGGIGSSGNEYHGSCTDQHSQQCQRQSLESLTGG